MKKLLLLCFSVVVLSCMIYYFIQDLEYVKSTPCATCQNVSYLAAETDELKNDSDKNEETTSFELISKWCTDNEGFISLLELAVSIVTTVVTVCLTVQIAKLPYLKKLYFWSYNERRKGIFKVFIILINSGYHAIRIDRIEIYCERKRIGGFTVRKSSKNYLDVGRSQQFVIPLYNLEEGKYEKKKMKIIIFDIQGKKYKYTSGFQLG